VSRPAESTLERGAARLQNGDTWGLEERRPTHGSAAIANHRSHRCLAISKSTADDGEDDDDDTEADCPRRQTSVFRSRSFHPKRYKIAADVQAMPTALTLPDCTWSSLPTSGSPILLCLCVYVLMGPAYHKLVTVK